MKRAVSIVLSLVLLVSLALKTDYSVFGAESSIDDPVIHYTFDDSVNGVIENSGTLGSSYNAQLKELARIDKGFIGDGCLDLGGEPDYVELPDGIVENCDDITTSIWVNRDRLATWQAIYSFTNGTDQYMLLTPQGGDGATGVSLVIKHDNTPGVDKSELEHRIAIGKDSGITPINDWYNITVTIDSTAQVARIYVNGKLEAEKTGYTATPAKMGKTTKNVIGAPSGYPDPYFKGKMDDLRIYDRALSAEEVAAMVDAQSQAYADWEFDQMEIASGEIYYDLELPGSSKQLENIVWSSSNENALTSDGRVIRPDYGTGAAKVKLKAVAAKNGQPIKKTYDMIIPDMSSPAPNNHVYQMQNGNPVIPGYYADTSILYDEQTGYFFGYGTNDGNSGQNVWPAQIWYSKDLINWDHKNVEMPEEWFQGTGIDGFNPNPDHLAVWAPSIVYNDKNGYYYVTYCLDGKGHMGKSKSLFGPWEDANRDEPFAPLVNQHDAQFFKDTNGDIYYTFGAWDFGVVKLSFDSNGDIFVEEDGDPRRKWKNERKATPFTYARMQNLDYCFEASEIIERDGMYYILWSWDGGYGYNVRYAVADNPLGPYREINNSMKNPILVRDDSKKILGPGHHSTFVYEDEYYISYHRQHYPYIDSKRQTCIEKLVFNDDGSIQKVDISHKGLSLFENTDTRNNLALGKQTRVSSARDYAANNITNVNFRYDGCFAVNENFATRWDPGVDALNPWIIVDLGSDCDVDSVEYLFEYTNKTYKYKTEYLAAADAKDIDMAAASDAWKLYEDNTETGAPASPVEFKKAVTARYMRLTITAAIGLPPNADLGDTANGANALSLFEFKVFGSASGDDLDRVFEAESFYGQYGIDVEASRGYGIHVSDITNNNYLKYNNVNLGNGAKMFQARAASNSNGGKIEIHMDEMNGPLLGVANISNTGDWQTWDVFTCELAENAADVHDIYLVFKGDEPLEQICNFDWFRFGEANVDKSGLARALVAAKASMDGYYVKETLEKLNEVYQLAQEVYDKSNASQDEVNEIEGRLLEAIEGLVYAGGIQAKFYTIDRVSVDRGSVYPRELEEKNLKAIVIDDKIDFSMDPRLLEHTGQDDFAGVRWTGRIQAPVTGEYTFTTYTDNGCRLYFEGDCLIDWWVNDWNEYKTSKSLRLTEGEIYEFEMEYMELEGGSIAQLFWSINGGIQQIIPSSAYRLPILNMESTDEVLKEALTKEKAAYSPETWSVFESVLTNLQELSEGTFTLQHQLEEAVDALKTAMSNLRERERSPLARIEITNEPDKLVYVQGEPLDLTGMVITAFYEDGFSKTVTDYKVMGYDKDHIGAQDLTVSYEEEGITKFAAFKVSVHKEIVSEPVIVLPQGKDTIQVGDNFDPMEGVTAYDEKDGDLTDEIIVTGSVDTSKAGTYKLSYSVTNSAGIEARETRQIVVEAIPEESGDTDEETEDSSDESNETEETEQTDDTDVETTESEETDETEETEETKDTDEETEDTDEETKGTDEEAKDTNDDTEQTEGTDDSQQQSKDTGKDTNGQKSSGGKQKDNGAKGKTSGKSKNPKTDDLTSISITIVMAGISATGLLLVSKKRKNGNHK